MQEGNRKLSVAVSSELEARIIALRKKDEFCRMTISEIVRMLIQKGLESEREAT